MSWKELRTTRGDGSSFAQPTATKQSNSNDNPFTNMSRGSGNLVLVNVAGTVTITSSSLPWNKNPAIGDEILISGFVNTGNNGRFTVTAFTGLTVVFTNASATTETLASAQNLIKLLHTPIKIFQDVIMTSGVPTYEKVTTDTALTLTPVGGTYTYLSCINTTDADCVITVAGGEILCPAGASLGHEIKPFTNEVTAVATGASSGYVLINIS